MPGRRVTTGGRAPRPPRPPALDVSEWVNAITLNEVPRNAAHYINVDVTNGRIQRVYALDSLQRWLQHSGGQASSPVTRRPFSARHIKKVRPDAVAYQAPTVIVIDN